MRYIRLALFLIFASVSANATDIPPDNSTVLTIAGNPAAGNSKKPVTAPVAIGSDIQGVGPSSSFDRISETINAIDVPTAIEPEGKKPKDDWSGAVGRFFFDLKLTDTLLAIFTGLLWWSTNKLWKETKALAKAAIEQSADMKQSIVATKAAADAAAKTATVAEKALYITERAYIGLDNFGLQNFLPGKLPSLIYTAINTGKTSGTITEIILKYYIGNEIPETPNYDNPHLSAPVQIQSMRSVTGHTAFNEKLTYSDYNDLISGTKSLFWWIKLTYTDTLQKTHIDGFALQFTPNRSMVPLSGNVPSTGNAGGFKIYRAPSYIFSYTVENDMHDEST